MLVVDRARRAGQVVDRILFDIEWETDFVPDYLETGVVQQFDDIALHAGDEVVGTENLASTREQILAQMMAEVSCAAGRQYVSKIVPETQPASNGRTHAVLTLRKCAGVVRFPQGTLQCLRWPGEVFG